jgi:hypothetical protein
MNGEYLVTDLGHGGWELREQIEDLPVLYCRGHYVMLELDGSLHLSLDGERDYFAVPGEVMSKLVQAYAAFMSRQVTK